MSWLALNPTKPRTTYHSGCESIALLFAYHSAAVPRREYKLAEIHGSGIIHIEDAADLLSFTHNEPRGMDERTRVAGG